jgi:hypothetical protein
MFDGVSSRGTRTGVAITRSIDCCMVNSLVWGRTLNCSGPIIACENVEHTHTDTNTTRTLSALLSLSLVSVFSLFLSFSFSFSISLTHSLFHTWSARGQYLESVHRNGELKRQQRQRHLLPHVRQQHDKNTAYTHMLSRVFLSRLRRFRLLLSILFSLHRYHIFAQLIL